MTKILSGLALVTLAVASGTALTLASKLSEGATNALTYIGVIGACLTIWGVVAED